MRRIFALASAAALGVALTCSGPAFAHGPGYRHGGWHHPHGWHQAWRGGWRHHGMAWNYAYPYNFAWGYGYPYNNDWGFSPVAAALTAPLAVAAAATAPLMTGRSVAVGGYGNYCATDMKTCLLYDTAYLGTGCSCKVPGGRARGLVTN
ncbi:hypothetical protein [Methylocapsa acidiphila]|uniref:hypothetical protein n=1 Tax=Methylocapsa acidiphila TaxID=133552 RepID=UPI000A04184A|nr:hypothetical protein [Methylocapsa acidiphila]